jgi:hypothetical protein
MDRLGVEEPNSHMTNNRPSVITSKLSNYSGPTSKIMDKTDQPSLLDLMGDEISRNLPHPRTREYADSIELQMKHDRKVINHNLAEERLIDQTITKKDGVPFKLCSGIRSICEKQDICLFDYLYFLKKLAFIMILLFFIYLSNFSNNVSGSYLASGDKLTGFEMMTLANINGLEGKLRFETERDDGMESVASSRFLTLIIDFTATLVLIGLITLRVRWRVYTSDYAIKLVNIDKEYRGNIEIDIRKHFGAKYGQVHEVTVIKDTGDILKYQMEVSRMSRKVGDLKAKNLIKGVENSRKLTGCLKLENNLKDKLNLEKQRIDGQKLEIGGAFTKEIYVIFEMPLHKKLLLENTIEIGEFISKAKDPKKRRFM